MVDELLQDLCNDDNLLAVNLSLLAKICEALPAVKHAPPSKIVDSTFKFTSEWPTQLGLIKYMKLFDATLIMGNGY